MIVHNSENGGLTYGDIDKEVTNLSNFMNGKVEILLLFGAVILYFYNHDYGFYALVFIILMEVIENVK